MQFNLSCAGVEEIPDVIAPTLVATIRQEMAARGITMSAISGTFNMIHPDMAERQAGLRRLRTLAAACASLGTSVITLCTGTRNTESMWRSHPDNGSEDAWRDLVVSMHETAAIAEEYGVTMAFEPEASAAITG